MTAAASMGAFRPGRSVRALPYDAEVEYLESTGTQWIDTGVVFDASENVRIIARSQPISEYRTVVCGSFIEGPDVAALSLEYGGTTQGKPKYLRTWAEKGTGVDVWSAVPYPNAETVICGWDATACRGTLSVGGETRYTSQINRNVQYRNTLRIFRDHRTASTESGSILHPLRVFGLQIEVESALVRDFIPVRVGTEGAMYDRRGVGGMDPDGSARGDGLYRNRGSGAFIIGADR